MNDASGCSYILEMPEPVIHPRALVRAVDIGVFLFEGVLVFGHQIANSVVAGGGLSEVMRIMISNGIILINAHFGRTCVAFLIVE